MSGSCADRSAEQLLSEARHELARLGAENERLRRDRNEWRHTASAIEVKLQADRDAWRNLCREMVAETRHLNPPFGDQLRNVVDRARARLKETDRG